MCVRPRICVVVVVVVVFVLVCVCVCVFFFFLSGSEFFCCPLLFFGGLWVVVVVSRSV